MTVEVSPLFVSHIVTDSPSLSHPLSLISACGHLSYLFLPIRTPELCTILAIVCIPHTLWTILAWRIYYRRNRWKVVFGGGQTNVNNYDFFGGAAYHHIKRLC